MTEVPNLDLIPAVMAVTNIDAETLYEVAEAEGGLVVHTVAYALG